MPPDTSADSLTLEAATTSADLSPGREVLPHLEQLAEQVAGFIGAAKAGNTLWAYAADWRDFTSWCAAHRRPSLPASPETVALYIADLAGRRTAATIGCRLTAIARLHEMAGQASAFWKSFSNGSNVADRSGRNCGSRFARGADSCPAEDRPKFGRLRRCVRFKLLILRNL